MAYIALYRKYRPEKFADVVGQEHVKRTLMNAIKRDQLSHAYLFSGPRGTGKTTVARILARASNCVNLHDGEPCGECDNCQSIAKGSWGVVEIDGASHNSVDDIRDLQEVIHHVPMKGRYTVYIIDEVHMLTKPAFNAFLKTLEEPPQHARFIMATTEPYKLPKTILSRCQHFAFTYISLDQIRDQVKKITSLEGVKITDDAAEFIAVHGRGSMRDTISLLDQAVIFSGDSITLDSLKELLGVAQESIITSIVDCMLDQDSGKLLTLVDEIIVTGQDLNEISIAIIGHLRNMMLVKSGVTSERILGFISDQLPRIQAQAVRVDQDNILSAIEYFSEAAGRMKFDIDQRLGLETALLGSMRHLAGINKPVRVARTEQPVKAQPSPQPATTESKASFPSKPVPQSKPQVSEDKGILRPRKSDMPKPESKPQSKSQADESKKKLNDNFADGWSAFTNWLREENLPVYILIRGIDSKLDNSSINLTFTLTDEYRYQFALQDKIPEKLGNLIKNYSGESFEVDVSFDKNLNPQNSETAPLLDPSMSEDIRQSRKMDSEQWVRENFLVYFPDGDLKWENES